MSVGTFRTVHRLSNQLEHHMCFWSLSPRCPWFGILCVPETLARSAKPPSSFCVPSQRAFVVVTRCPLGIGKPCDVRGSDGLFRDMCFTDLGHIQPCGTTHIAVALIGQKLSNERGLLQETPLLRESDTKTGDQHSPHLCWWVLSRSPVTGLFSDVECSVVMLVYNVEGHSV